jgi:hypothetical protein
MRSGFAIAPPLAPTAPEQPGHRSYRPSSPRSLAVHSPPYRQHRPA